MMNAVPTISWFQGPWPRIRAWFKSSEQVLERTLMGRE